MNNRDWAPSRRRARAGYLAGEERSPLSLSAHEYVARRRLTAAIRKCLRHGLIARLLYGFRCAGERMHLGRIALINKPAPSIGRSAQRYFIIHGEFDRRGISARALANAAARDRERRRLFHLRAKSVKRPSVIGPIKIVIVTLSGGGPASK